MMLRCFLCFVLIGMLAGCGKKVDLPEVTVSAADAGEFARFRSELGNQFATDRLRDFDTAVQELKLDAMNRDIATSDAREADMRAVIDGKSIHAATLLGWEARRARFLREMAFINKMLEADLKVQQNAGPQGPSSVVLARIDSAKNVIAQIQANADETERRLAGLRAVQGK